MREGRLTGVLGHVGSGTALSQPREVSDHDTSGVQENTHRYAACSSTLLLESASVKESRTTGEHNLTDRPWVQASQTSGTSTSDVGLRVTNGTHAQQRRASGDSSAGLSLRIGQGGGGGARWTREHDGWMRNSDQGSYLGGECVHHPGQKHPERSCLVGIACGPGPQVVCTEFGLPMYRGRDRCTQNANTCARTAVSTCRYRLWDPDPNCWEFLQ